MRTLRRVNPTYRGISYWQDDLEDLFKDIDQMLTPFNHEQIEQVPACEVREGKKAYFIAMDLPGVKRKNIDITIENRRLTIAAKKEKEHLSEDTRIRLMERKAQTYVRNFLLPERTDIDRIEAEFEDGVLRLHIPKNPIQERFKLKVGDTRKESIRELRGNENEKIKMAN